MKKGLFPFIALLFVSSLLRGQKPPINYNLFDEWKSISSQTISDDGKWISYEINPQQGDGWLYIYNVAASVKDSVSRGKNATFSPESKYLVYQVVPTFAETRQAKRKKLKEDKMPKKDLEIRILSTNEIVNVENVKSFSLPSKNSYWLAYLMEKKPEDKKSTSAVDTTSVGKPAISIKTKTPTAKGTDLIIYNPLLHKEYKYNDVTEYIVAEDGKTICFLQSVTDTSKTETLRLNIFETAREGTKIIFEKKGSVKKLKTDKIGNLVSFLYSADTAKVKVYSLWLSNNQDSAVSVIDINNKAMPKGWSVSENGNLSFSDDAKKLFFGTSKKPIKEPEDTLLADEKYKLDIWSWNDDLLQPMQKKQLDQELKRTWMAVYHIDSKVMVQLADSNMPVVRTFQKGNNSVALGISDLKYRKFSSWEGGGDSDYYIVNIKTGTKTLALEKCSSRATLSPSCKYLLFWDNIERAWMSKAVSGGVTRNITLSINFPLFDELNDVPDDPSPYGLAGWMEDDRHVLIYDRYDIWLVDLEALESPVNITSGFGRSNKIVLRYLKLDPDLDYISKKDNMYLSAFREDTKESGFYTLKPGKSAEIINLIMAKASFPGNLTRAKNTDMFIWRMGTFEDYPELFVSNKDFGNGKKISVTNPQQVKYNWGTTQLVEWDSFDHQKLQGILYKPEDFDPLKKYPMIVYFYERSSDELYNYMPPAPSASIINRTFAVSNGYIVFVPDIPYVIGYPGQSCYNAVLSGTYALLDRYDFIDKNRLGLDGQSWGGYQIAYLVTQTDLFACAYAGAVVSNMTSAYGGIRWESGISRMFQYEHTQSRIGGTLWEKPLLYIENSPIFFVPKINTPLLLMHNDADGAVPWYQGIEFITALRRLEKPAWMLSYNDEAHNLMNRANRKDISIRKMQFFDHYLKGAPMPYWMKYGLTQLEKGKIDGYNLVSD